MSSMQVNTTPPVHTSSTPSESPTSQSASEAYDPSVPGPTGAELPPAGAELLLTADAKDVRQIIRLIQCGVCSHILRDPTTLPCGQSLCKRCIPEVHVRTNISWPATANRRLGFQCPFPACKREHATGDCSVDVTLNKALASIRSAIEQDQGLTGPADLSTHVTIQDHWDVAGLPKLQEKDDHSQVLKGGRIVSTYSLADAGKLEYGSEAVYFSVGATEDEVTQIDTTIFTRLKESTRPEMDCQVCYALFLDPLTTACGHTFCRTCLHRVLDHSAYCPICRRALSIQPQLNPSSFPSNHRLNKIIDSCWADTVALRSEAVRVEQQSHGDFDIPIFVCALSFPAMPMFLHIFEPRYRLMIRRAMDATRTFGMVTYREALEPGGLPFMEIGTLLRIVSIEFFPDGRSLLETVGISRFKVLRHGMQDGYVVGNIEKIDDISLAEEEEIEMSETMRGQGVRDFSPQPTTPPEAAHTSIAARTATLTVDDLDTLSTRELLEFGVGFVRRMRARSAPWLTARTLAIYGECPTDPALFPWWLASVLPVTDEEKYRVLSTSSVRDRLKICCRWAIEWEASSW